jgi:hypothetical protein
MGFFGIMKARTLWLTFWPGWVLANGIGWFLLTIIYILPFGGPFWGFRIAVALGFLLGLLQWSALQRNGLADSMWIWLSIFPYSLFFLAFILIGSSLSLVTFILVHIVCFGLLGLLQRPALAYYVNNATVWIFASPIASVLGMIISGGVGNFLFRQLNPGFYWMFSGIVYGSITGAVIIFLSSSTIKEKGLSKNDK